MSQAMAPRRIRHFGRRASRAKRQLESATLALAAGNRETAAEFPHDTGGDRKSKARACASLRQRASLFEFPKNTGLFRPAHARAGVFDGDVQFVTDHARPDDDAAFPREFDGIAEEIEEDLTKPGRIEIEMIGYFRRNEGCNLYTFFMGAMGEHLNDALNQPPQVLRARIEPEAASLHGRIIQQILDQLHQ